MIKRKVLFLISHLNVGGAERQLVNLVRGLNPEIWDIRVLCMVEKGQLASELEGYSNISILTLDRASLPKGKFISRMLREIRVFQPHLIHGYLVSAHFYLLLLKPFLPKAKLILGIRSGFIDVDSYGAKTRLMYRTTALLSGCADSYILNSYCGAALYSAQGYDSQKISIVPNGIDTQCWQPNLNNVSAARAAMNCGADDLVIAIVASIEHMKDHLTFVRAAAEVAPLFAQARFVVIGRELPQFAPRVKELVAALGLESRFSFLGNRADVPALLSGVDLLCSSSIGEGFSNSIAEAMSAGVPCVVTDVGDSARIVGDTGLVVKANDPVQLGAAICRLLQLSAEERRTLGDKARKRIQAEYGIESMVNRTERVYLQVLSEGRK